MNATDAISLVNKSVRDIKQYHLEPIRAQIKLNQNENPNDWPDAIKNELAEFCRTRPWNRYPAFIPENLKKKLAIYAGHRPDGVIVGNGSNEVLLVLMLSFVTPGKSVIICQPTFTVYGLIAGGMGASVTNVFLKNDLSFDVDAICDNVKEKPGSLLFLCSPNNPTGTCIDEKDIRKILGVHTGIFVLDQAYIEFGGFNAVTMLAEYPNLIITRTFSKAMAGAGLRLGYMLADPQLLHEINKIKLPYNINFFSEHVAETLLDHTDMVKKQVSELVAGRDLLLSFFRNLPFDNVYGSGANFMLVRLSRKKELFDDLVKKGILVRDVSSYPMLDNCLRINVGTNEENAALMSALKDFFRA
jgi:histidinol-phosphate aminotransferase